MGDFFINVFAEIADFFINFCVDNIIDKFTKRLTGISFSAKFLKSRQNSME